MSVIRFHVAGGPVTQGSKRAFAHRTTGRVVVVDDNSPALLSWRRRIGQEAQAVQDFYGSFAEHVPVAMEINFWLPKPTSAPKRKRVWPTGRRDDIDKLARAVLDAVTKVLVHDDGQVVRMFLAKDYHPEGWCGVEVVIREVGS